MIASHLASFKSAAEEIARIDRVAELHVTGSDGARIVWRSWGQGPPLVLIHGDFGSWTHWARNVLPLGRNYRVLAVDMPGYGESDKPLGAWSPESIARSLAEGLSTLLPLPERYILAGFSFGGIIAAHLAAVEGKRIEQLALFGPGGFGPPLGQVPPVRRLNADMELTEIIATHRQNLTTLMIADPAKVDDLAVFIQIENIRHARLRAGMIPLSDSLMRALPHVRARLHVTYGERDAIAAAELTQREQMLRRFQSDLAFHLIPAAGHWTPYETPERVNELLREMLHTR